MDTTVKNKSFIPAKSFAELLPGLRGILSEDTIQTLTAKKAPRPTIVQTSTAEKVFKPLTIAEMKAGVLCSLKDKSPKKFAKSENLKNKRNWNSSVKLENKTKSCTGVGQLKANSVRKVLNFQTKAIPRSQQTMLSKEAAKSSKPESRTKKTAVGQTNNIRISGICEIQETPIISNKLIKVRSNIVNKENSMNRMNHIKKAHETPKSFNQKQPIKSITPHMNISFKSHSDASFLQKEEEINKSEEKIKAIWERTLENIAEVSPRVSTPFKDYRSIEQFFNDSNDMDNSVLYNDNTIMSFDNVPLKNNKEGGNMEESVIVSLCDLLNDATIKDTKKNRENANTELNLQEVEKETEQSIKMIERGIEMLLNIKESHLKSLQYVRELMNEQKNKNTQSNNMCKTLVESIPNTNIVKQERLSPEKSPVTRPSVIKMNSPSYKIPKKNLCLRKKVFHKSIPNVSNKTPIKEANKALDMYIQMKQNMKFLNTPVVNHDNMRQPDTPAITSCNLKMQLDKLFNCS